MTTGQQIAEEYYSKEPLSKARLAQIIDTTLATRPAPDTQKVVDDQPYIIGSNPQQMPPCYFDGDIPAKAAPIAALAKENNQ
jgi:hypothetical protein